MDLIGTFVSLGTLFGINLILTLSLNLEYGYCGQPNFGKVAFFAVGAFVTARVSDLILLKQPIDPFSPLATSLKIVTATQDPLASMLYLVIALAGAAGIAGVFGYLASYPALRLRTDFLAIVLLAFGEMLRNVARNYYPLVGGTLGVGGIPNPFIWIGNYQETDFLFASLVLGLAIAAFLILQMLAHSPFGRMLRAIRDDDVASMSMGKKVPWVRGQTLIIGSAFAGIAGALFAMYSGFVMADDYIPIKTFEIWVMMMLGGVASNRGALLGALVFTGLDRVISIFVGELPKIMSTPFEVSYMRYIILGIIMLLILRFRPKGLIPEKAEKTGIFKETKNDKDSRG
jgi:branched-chain amino acid transport system permease protein